MAQENSGLPLEIITKDFGMMGSKMEGGFYMTKIKLN